MADTVTFSLPNQNTPEGYYKIEWMLKAALMKKGKAKPCGSCSNTGLLKNIKLVYCRELSTMKQLTLLTI
jgi:hypothetical protein